ncbi:MAG: ATP-binding protein [Balneolales bacterium]
MNNLKNPYKSDRLAVNNEHIIMVPASTEYLNRVRSFVADLARQSGFSEADVEDIRLAVDEACTNVIKHAYNYDSSKKIQVKVSINAKQLNISLYDSGNCFDPDTFRKPNLKEQVLKKMRGGMGIYLIKKSMDKVQYRRDDTINEICMTKIRR